MITTLPSLPALSLKILAIRAAPAASAGSFRGFSAAGRNLPPSRRCLIHRRRLRGRVLRPSLRSRDRKSTRLNSSHVSISYAVFCLKKKKKKKKQNITTKTENKSRKHTGHQ